MSTVDIAGVDKGQLLAALFNHSRVRGLGVLQDIGRDLTVEEARTLVESIMAGGPADDSDRHFGPRHRQPRLVFDYLYGRPLKVDITGDEVDAWGYDRDNGGVGALAHIVDQLRESAAPVAEGGC